MIQKKKKDCQECFEEMMRKLGVEKVTNAFDLPDIELPEELTMRCTVEIYVGQKEKITAGNFMMRLTAKDGTAEDIVGVCGGPYAIKTEKELARLVFESVVGAIHKAHKTMKKKNPPPPDTGPLPDGSGSKKVN